jgi:hypothetical protein
MREFDKIFLSWRKGMGSVRHIVGVLERTTDDRFAFSYMPDRIKAEATCMAETKLLQAFFMSIAGQCNPSLA